MNCLDSWKWLHGPAGAKLLNSLDSHRDPSINELAKLHQAYGADRVSTAIELLRARRKGARKFAATDHLWCDVAGIEQSSSERVAALKAQRFAELGSGQMVDLCCGIGGDSIALAKVAEVLAVDLSNSRAWMAGTNANCEYLASDVRLVDLGDRDFHLDPARRVEGGERQRIWEFEDYEPGPKYIRSLLRSSPHGGIKLGPSVDFTTLPTPEQSELELIADCGDIVQAMLWCGKLAGSAIHGDRRASSINKDGSHISYCGRPQAIDGYLDLSEAAHLYVSDIALSRADLVGCWINQHAPGELSERAPGLGLLHSKTAIDSPWFKRYQIIETMAWREKKVKQALRQLNAGEVTVKVRGKTGEANAIAKRLNNKSRTGQPLTVFLHRIGKKVEAIIAAVAETTAANKSG